MSGPRMSGREVGGWAFAAPLSAWAAAALALIVLGTEHVLSVVPSGIVGHARVAAYVSAFASFGVTGALAVLFVLATGGMLWWIDRPVPPRLLVAASCHAAWVLAAYCSILVVGILMAPPLTASFRELVGAPDIGALAFQSGSVLRHAGTLRTGAMVLGGVAVLRALAPRTGLGYALLSVLFGASTVAFVGAMLARLATLQPL